MSPDMQSSYLSLFTRWMRRRWSEINQEVLGGRLELPVFAVIESGCKLGSWEQATRTLALSSRLLFHHSELEIEETLKHEIAHQFADEILDAVSDPGETPHGAAFRYACDRLGISHAAGLKSTVKASPMLEKIRKLLALAESPNVHEAEIAMARARALMEKYELDLGVHDHDFCYAYLGGPHKQKAATAKMISSLLICHFGVVAVWIPSRMIQPPRTVWLLEINGSATNIEIAEYVHDYLRAELEILWQARRLSNPAEKGRSLKRDFQLGVLRGLHEKLGAEQAPPPSRAHHELVLLKQEKLQGFFRERHPSTQKGRSILYRRTDAYHAGYEHGKSMDIRKGIRKRSGGPIKRLES